MAFVPIPKDLTKVKTKFMFNLTARQVACFSLAGVVAVPSYIAVKDFVGNQIAVFIVMAIAAPFIFFAMFERDGLTGEKYLMKIIEFKYKKSAVRIYKNVNIYETMNDIKKLEKNFEEDLVYKEEIRLQKKQPHSSSSKRKDG